MFLYLVRHGEAVDEAEDPERPLSARGIQEVSLTGQFLKSINARPKSFLCSEKLRSRQTAQRIIDVMGFSEKIEQRKGLSPKDAPENLLDELALRSEDLLIAGHSPFLPKLAALLLCGRADADAFPIASGGIIRLEREGRGAWRLSLAISPAEILESL
ncbi:MAG: phosphohistidine phosphatase SixA [Synergistales bacterium]|jgi:phosphohistidine phosphatase